jgi:hypothetical protein
LSDISLGLEGLIAVLLMWSMAAGYAALALVFCVLSLRTGRKHLWGRRMIVSIGLAGALGLAGSQIHRLPIEARNALDEANLWWGLPAFGLGIVLCFLVGQRTR